MTAGFPKANEAPLRAASCAVEVAALPSRESWVAVLLAVIEPWWDREQRAIPSRAGHVWQDS